jgi:hypothetical protein
LVAWLPIQDEFLSGVNVSILAKQYHIINTSEVPAPDPRTSEDCLFLDVVVPMSIYNSKYARQSRGEICDCEYNSTGAPSLYGSMAAFWYKAIKLGAVILPL